MYGESSELCGALAVCRPEAFTSGSHSWDPSTRRELDLMTGSSVNVEVSPCDTFGFRRGMLGSSRGVGTLTLRSTCQRHSAKSNWRCIMAEVNKVQ